MVKYACKVCKRILTTNKCPDHPDAKVTESWKGRAIILDPEHSELAKRMNITKPGEYAIRV